MSYIQHNPADQGNSVLIFIGISTFSCVYRLSDRRAETYAGCVARTDQDDLDFLDSSTPVRRKDRRTDRQTDNRCFSRVVPDTTRRPSKNRLYLNPCCCCCCCCLEPFNSDTVSTASECIGCETMANGGRRTNNFFTNSNLRRNTSRKNAYTVVN